MQWLTVLACLVTLVVTTAGQGIPGVSEDALTQLFGTPPPDIAETDDDCECVIYYQCNDGALNEHGEGLIDIRGRGCENSLHKCCSAEHIDTGRTKPTEPPTTPDQHDNGCGMRKPKGVGFEITGALEGESNFGEFPWMVAVMTKEDPMRVYKCGGSLIHHQVVLTAAHSIENLRTDSLVVRAGEWDTQTTDEPYMHQDRDVANVIRHENYYAGDVRNDVALLMLESPIDTEPHIGFVCLPTQGQNVDNRCFASGWGKENFGKSGQYQSILKSIELPIMPRDRCTAAFRTTRLGQHFKLHESFICAGGEPGKDVCTGDGGGPLVCPMRGEPARYLQAGIVAWGIGCGEHGVPGAYASVAMFRNWIDRKMRAEGFGTDTYSKP